MKNLQIGTFKPHKLSRKDKTIWNKFMTPEYVYTDNDNNEYVYMRFKGYDHMEEEWHIVKIAEVK